MKDAIGAMNPNSKSAILKTVIVLWITWPALCAALISNETKDFLEYVLKHYFLYPPSIDNITNYWLADGALWQRIYVKTWCINGYILMVMHIFYLLFIDQSKWLEDAQKKSVTILLIMGIFSIFMSLGFYLGWFFSTEKPLTQKAAVILTNDIGLVLLFPLVWSGTSIFFISGIAFLYIVVMKFFNRTTGAK